MCARLCWAVTSKREGWLVELKVEVRKAAEFAMELFILLTDVSVS